MATADLQVTSVTSASPGWGGTATVANLEASDDSRATGGGKNDDFVVQIQDAPGDFDSLNTVQLFVEGRRPVSGGRDISVTVELQDSGGTVLESFTSQNFTTSDVTYFSTSRTRSDNAATINGYQMRVLVNEGGGMAQGDEEAQIDHVFLRLDYNTAGTTFTQTVTGSVTPAGALARATSLLIEGSITAAGALARKTVTSLSGSITATGALLRKALKALSGSITASGTLGTLKLVQLLLTGSITATGALARKTARTLSGSITAGGDLTRKTFVLLTGSITAAGTAGKKFLLTLTGSITAAGAVTSRAVIQLLLTGSITAAGALSKGAKKALSGSVTAAGALSRKTLRLLSGTITPVGALVKKTFQLLTGSITMAGALGTAASFFQAVSGSITAAGNAVGQKVVVGAGGVVKAMKRLGIKLGIGT